MCGIAGIVDPQRGTPQETLEQIVTRMMDSDLHQVIYTRDSPLTRAGNG